MTPHEELTPELQQAIADLRLSLTNLAESALPGPRPAPSRPWGWAFAATAAACTLLAGATLHHPGRAPAALPQATTQQEDEALLDGIHNDLATPIAPSLTPLTPTPR